MGPPRLGSPPSSVAPARPGRVRGGRAVWLSAAPDSPQKGWERCRCPPRPWGDEHQYRARDHQRVVRAHPGCPRRVGARDAWRSRPPVGLWAGRGGAAGGCRGRGRRGHGPARRRGDGAGGDECGGRQGGSGQSPSPVPRPVSRPRSRLRSIRPGSPSPNGEAETQGGGHYQWKRPPPGRGCGWISKPSSGPGAPSRRLRPGDRPRTGLTGHRRPVQLP